jgi:hypothetical protein
MAMIEVRFLRHYGSYNGGEVAGFPDRDAQALVDSGNAELFLRPPVEEVAPPPEVEEIAIDPPPARRKRNR